MASMIQIRNVPDALHRQIKARAALEGVSMSRYILGELERAISRPTRRQLLETIRLQAEVRLDSSPAEDLERERNARDESRGA